MVSSRECLRATFVHSGETVLAVFVLALFSFLFLLRPRPRPSRTRDLSHRDYDRRACSAGAECKVVQRSFVETGNRPALSARRKCQGHEQVRGSDTPETAEPGARAALRSALGKLGQSFKQAAARMGHAMGETVALPPRRVSPKARSSPARKKPEPDKVSSGSRFYADVCSRQIRAFTSTSRTDRPSNDDQPRNADRQKDAGRQERAAREREKGLIGVLTSDSSADSRRPRNADRQKDAGLQERAAREKNKGLIGVLTSDSSADSRKCGRAMPDSSQRKDERVLSKTSSSKGERAARNSCSPDSALIWSRGSFSAPVDLVTRLKRPT